MAGLRSLCAGLVAVLWQAEVVASLEIQLLQWNLHGECFQRCEGHNHEHCDRHYPACRIHSTKYLTELMEGEHAPGGILDFGGIEQLGDHEFLASGLPNFGRSTHICGGTRGFGRYPFDVAVLYFNKQKWEPVSKPVGGCMEHVWGSKVNNYRAYVMQTFQHKAEPHTKVVVVVAHYSHAVWGLPEMRQELRMMHLRTGVAQTILLADTNRECGTSSWSIMHALYPAARQAVLDPGDEVLIPDPAWPNYEMATRLFGPGQPVRYHLDSLHAWEPNLADIRSKITARTKALVICSPSNPTGAVFDKVTMQSLLDTASANGLYVISDEIYSALNFAEGYPQSVSVLECAHDPAATMVVSGVSKAWAMTGFRVGWLVADPEIVRLGEKLQEAFISCGAAASQRAALAALEDPHTPAQVQEMVSSYHRRRDLALSVLQRHGLASYTPGGAMYLLVPCGDGVDSPTFCRNLLQARRVAVTPGTTFGENSRYHVRVSFGAADEVVEEGVDRLCRAILGKP